MINKYQGKLDSHYRESLIKEGSSMTRYATIRQKPEKILKKTGKKNGMSKKGSKSTAKFQTIQASRLY